MAFAENGMTHHCIALACLGFELPYLGCLEEVLNHHLLPSPNYLVPSHHLIDLLDLAYQTLFR